MFMYLKSENSIDFDEQLFNAFYYFYEIPVKICQLGYTLCSNWLYFKS